MEGEFLEKFVIQACNYMFEEIEILSGGKKATYLQ